VTSHVTWALAFLIIWPHAERGARFVKNCHRIISAYGVEVLKYSISNPWKSQVISLVFANIVSWILLSACIAFCIHVFQYFQWPCTAVRMWLICSNR